MIKLWNKIKAHFEEKPPVLKDPAERVFTINGVGYYKFKDISKVKCQRAMVTSDWYNELAMRATREFLIKHTEAIDKLLGSTSIDIYKIKTLNMQLKERLEMIYETDIIYKIASVVFFTKDEDPYQYDDLLGREKVNLFKEQDKDDKNMGFFFGKLFSTLIGSQDLSEKDLQTYMTVGAAITKEHLKTISTILSN